MESKLPIQHLTGVILAGGKSERFGTDKALVRHRGERFIDHALDVLKGIFPKLMIVTNSPEKYRDLPATILTDEVPFQGPAGGIVTALRFVKTEGIFVVACDLPLLTQKVIRNLIRRDDGSDLVLYQHKKGVEPLCAIYRKSLLPILKTRLRNGRLDLHSLCDEEIQVKKVPLPKGDARAILNVNRPEDLRKRIR